MKYGAISAKAGFLAAFITMTPGCGRRQAESDHPAPRDSTAAAAVQRKAATYHTTLDTIDILIDTGDTLSYSRQQFNAVVDAHPEWYAEFPDDPDAAYLNNGASNGFNSEVGRDEYYALYATFLQKANGKARYAARRQNLLHIYWDINSLFNALQHGGTYFGHQDWRILGYVEYAVYTYRLQEDRLSKTYDITRQKEKYIQSLRQLIDDETDNDPMIDPADRSARKKHLYVLADRVDKAITDYFCLRKAQEFQYSYYQYF